MLYRYLEMIMIYGIMLFQVQEEPHFDPTIGVLELAIGFIIGLSPTIFNAIKDNVRWQDEKQVVQTEAVENIAQAASILSEQSQSLSDKNAALIGLYETALQRQVDMAETERARRIALEEQYSQEIEDLKKQITEINKHVIKCSKEILDIVRDIRDGKQITQERLDNLENTWKDK